MKRLQVTALLFLLALFAGCGESSDDKGSNNGNNNGDNNGDNNGGNNGGNNGDNNGDNNGEDDGIGADCRNDNDCDSDYCRERPGSSDGKCAVNDFGEKCRVGGGNEDCAHGVCVIKSDDDVFGYCTDVCDSFSDCPSFWECAELGNANGKFCLDK